MSILNIFKTKPHHMPREIAAGYIEAFANGTLHDPYAWDDFETIPHANPEVDFALHLCWWAAKKYPARNDHEYMAPSAVPFFLRIAALLRNGALAPFIEGDKQSILAGNMPRELAELLQSNASNARPEPK